MGRSLAKQRTNLSGQPIPLTGFDPTSVPWSRAEMHSSYTTGERNDTECSPEDHTHSWVWLSSGFRKGNVIGKLFQKWHLQGREVWRASLWSPSLFLGRSCLLCSDLTNVNVSLKLSIEETSELPFVTWPNFYLFICLPINSVMYWLVLRIKLTVVRFKNPQLTVRKHCFLTWK